MVRGFVLEAGSRVRMLGRRAIPSLLVTRRIQSIVVVAVCAVPTVLVAITMRSLERTRDQWGQSTPVLVVTGTVAANEMITEHNSALVSLPAAIVPADALTERPLEARSRVALTPRSVVTPALLAAPADATAIPAGWRIVALPASLPMPPVEVGDVVDVVGGNSVLAASALMASMEPLTIAVPADLAPTVAAAARMGEISLVATR